MSFKKLIFLTISAICLVLLSISASLSEEYVAAKTYGQTSNYKVYSLKLPDSIEFSGEKFSLKENDLKERMDRELLVNTYWQSNMMLMIKKTSKYFPIIEQILLEEGIPDDFKYLPVIESGLENVRSPKGAKGFWQIMKATGKELGLEINSNVDERYNIELSTKAACRYLKKAKQELGSWTLAAASYNRGISGIKKKIKTQQVDNYYDLLLGTETKRYIFRLLAMKIILSNPLKYGFVYEKQDLYFMESLREFKIDTAISNISDFAKKKGINYKILKRHNPWLLENHLNNNSRKLFKLKVPE